MCIRDSLLFTTSVVREGVYVVPAYRYVSKSWYEWASQRGMVIRNYGVLERRIREMAEAILEECGRVGYSRRHVEEAILRNLSYPLLLLIAGVGATVPKRLEMYVPSYRREEVRRLAKKDLTQILKALGCRDAVDTDRIVELFDGRGSVIVPPYPSNEFVIGFVSKYFSEDLLKLYKEYSLFVHSYHASWHIFPFSSVLEFKVFNHELSKFSAKIRKIVDAYMDRLF